MSFTAGLHALLKSGEQLPTLPTVVFQLQRVLDDERSTAGDVAGVIERDPAMTARLLRAANSAAMSRGQPVASVTAAIQRLGVSQVRALCVALAVVQAFGSRERGLPHGLFWGHCGTVGLVSRRLWQRQGRTSGADDVYVAGLLHDVGLLVLDHFFPTEFDAVTEQRAEIDLPLWKAEEDFLGMDHGQIGGVLLGHWSLPPSVVEAVAHHHRLIGTAADQLAIARTVFAAEVLCGELGFGLPIEGKAETEGTAALAALDIAAADFDRVRDELWELAQESSGLLV